MNYFAKILKLFLAWRIFLFIPVIISSLLISPGRSIPFLDVNYHHPLAEWLKNPIFSTWSNFDGEHYMNIATRGYVAEARFFPLFPILIYIASLGAINYNLTFIVSFILPNIFFVAALIVLYKLLKLDYSSDISVNTIFFLLIFPTSFFYASVYTEGLFLLLLVSSFYFARTKKWKYALLSALLLVLTRVVGIFIIPALIFEYYLQNPKKSFKNFSSIFLISAIPLIGLAAYSIFNFFKWNKFLYFVTAHAELNNGRTSGSLVLPLQTLYRYFNILSSIPYSQFEWWIALLEVAMFLIIFSALIFCYIKKIRLSYLIFCLPAFLLPGFSGTFSGLPRYVVILFPIFILLAQAKQKWIKVTFSLISIILLTILTMYFSRGYFIA